MKARLSYPHESSLNDARFGPLLDIANRTKTGSKDFSNFSTLFQKRLKGAILYTHMGACRYDRNRISRQGESWVRYVMWKGYGKIASV